MEITKRNGSVEHYDKEKIATAIRKSFISTGNSVADTELYAIVGAVENVINTHADRRNVESIQDEVERKLMEKGFYNEAKSYILFRWKRTEQRKALCSQRFHHHLSRLAQEHRQTENCTPTISRMAHQRRL